jgi:predicted GTPase
MADVVVINKIDSAGINDVERLRKTIETVVPDAVVLEARSPIVIEDGADLAGKKVLVVEDGPTLTHGEMSYGAGVVAARQAGAAELVDARPWATGTIEEVYERYPHIGTLVPAMGYSEQQRKDLAETINASDADAVLIATPIDLRKVCELTKPAYRAVYDLDVVSTPDLADVLSERLGL